MRKLFSLFPLVLGYYCVSAQQNLINTSDSTGSTGIDNYDLYYGMEHIPYPGTIAGNAYFLGSEWIKGKILYDNRWYSDIPLKYDQVADKLIVQHPNEYFALILSSDKVQSFIIGNIKFVNVPQGKYANLKAGFYQELTAGTLSIFVKRTKFIDQSTDFNRLQKYITESVNYYGIREGSIAQINKQSKLLELVEPHGKSVSAIFKTRGIKFNKNKEQAILEAATIYNNLVKQP